MKLAWILTVSLLFISYVKSVSDPQYKNVNDLPNDIRNLKLTGVIASVYDGDTFRFYHLPGNMAKPNRIPNRDTLKVRLIGVDTPEMPREEDNKPGQPLAVEARDLVRKLIENKDVVLQLFSRDQYGRLLGSVDANGVPVSLSLVENGYAFVYRGQGAEYGNIKDALFAAEKRAKKNKKGIWGISDNMSPAEYKRRYG